MIINKDYSYSSNLFTWVPEASTLVTDMSMLGKGQIFRKDYDDAADLGLVITSERTGLPEVFYYDHAIAPQGELESLVLKPINPVLAAKGLKVVIFND